MGCCPRFSQETGAPQVRAPATKSDSRWQPSGTRKREGGRRKSTARSDFRTESSGTGTKKGRRLLAPRNNRGWRHDRGRRGRLLHQRRRSIPGRRFHRPAKWSASLSHRDAYRHRAESAGGGRDRASPVQPSAGRSGYDRGGNRLNRRGPAPNPHGRGGPTRSGVDLYAHANRSPRSFADAHSNPNHAGHRYAHTDSDCNRDSNSLPIANPNANCDRNPNSDAVADDHTHANPDAGAQGRARAEGRCGD